VKPHLIALAIIVAASPPGAQPAPRVATSFPAAEQAALEQVRKDVWTSWFAGDTGALRRVLGPELVAMDDGGKGWQSADETIKGSAEFAKGRGKLVSVRFDNGVTHRFGDVAVMFSVYTTVVESGGKRETRRGRATEVFVRSKGRWVHTSWQLDKSP